MPERRVKKRINEASAGYARGGSAKDAKSIKHLFLFVFQILGISALAVVLVVGAIFIAFKITMFNMPEKKSKNVTVCYGELEVITKRNIVYNGNNVCISLNNLKEMLSLTVIRSREEITLYTYNGDSISFSLESSEIKVNGIAFSVSSPAKAVDEDVFISADIVNRFISSTAVVEDEAENRITVITVEDDPASIYFSPKKSDEMGQMGKPATVQGGTSYTPDGTMPEKITTSIPDPVLFP